MKQMQPSTAKDVFGYLLTIITLFVGIFSIITLLFQYINFQFPDTLTIYYNDIFSAVRVAISCLIVVWPVFLFMSRYLNQELAEDKTKQDMWVRKWLLYLTLFVSAITVIVDLIVLTNRFLGGELTSRFALKVAAVLLVAISVLWYYSWELRRNVTQKTKVPLIAAIWSSVFILGWIIAGFFIIGSPQVQRQMRMDETRVMDLQNIQYAVINDWQQDSQLPESLESLRAKGGLVAFQDPETGTAYEYRATGDKSFELCATFSRKTPPKNADTTRMYPVSGMDNWDHEAGRQCFARTIDPVMWPPIAPVR